MASKRGILPFISLILILLALIIVPFLIWGAEFDRMLSLEGARKWMEQYGSWGWLAGIALMVGDIILPIPNTVVMSALGWMYGWRWGGVICTAGSMLSGIVAYGASRWLGRPAAHWIAGQEALERGEELFSKGGGWIVALSRSLPVLPEAVACLAGIVRMKGSVFLLALACGSFPLGFTFAAIGHLGHDRPGLALALSVAVPVVLWLLAGWFFKKPRS